ncbi:M20/M25/M40 family metallo-hydrolase [Mesorhizobium sp. 1B3]|uniref:M20/M25/M40 family metallo-hydrolase n=1 Tax=Mesorhizobium sp. 1B3 TaxID=3243599 RepID=UPI003D97A19C
MELREQVLSWIKDDEAELVAFLREFVQAASPNPPGDTRQAMSLVTSFLETEGLPFREVTAQPHLPNIHASFEGGRPGRHLLLNGHVDVFPVGNAAAWDRDPWSGALADGRVFGRGSADMKGGTTAALFAYRYLHRLRDCLSGKLTLMVVSDEETGGTLGSKHLIDTLADEVIGDCLLSGEPGGVTTIRFAEKGILQFVVDIRTRGAHGPYAHLSPSAIRIAGRIMDELDAVKDLKPDLPQALARRITGAEARLIIDETMGSGTADVIAAVSMNVGVIRGGSKVNMVASDCSMEVDIRVPVGVDRDRVLEMVRQIIARNPGAEIRDVFGGPPLYSDPEHVMANIISANVRQLGHVDPIRIPMLAASDCRLWREKGVPAFVYGTSPRNVSAPNESVLVEEFLHVVRVHTLSALDYLQQS